MERIREEVFTQIRELRAERPIGIVRGSPRAIPAETETDDKRWASVTRIRRSLGYPVTSFRDLAVLVAEVGFRNRRFNLLFRGQEADHPDRNGGSRLYPTIYRPKKGQKQLRTSTLRDRFDALHKAVRLLQEQRGELTGAPSGLSRQWEYYVALLQHYELRKTPFLDATHSLRVAASFALPGDAHKEGYMYVLGMPHPQGSISHFVDDDMVLVKLQNVCPPGALRPHFQEGYLLGRMSVRNREKEPGDNAGYRLLAKYKLVNANGRFWSNGFRYVPRAALLPTKDPFRDRLHGIVGDDPVP